MYDALAANKAKKSLLEPLAIFEVAKMVLEK